MQDALGERLRILKKIRIRNKRMLAVLLVLSLVVSLDVFWILRQPGWALAGDADCGILEHAHDAVCQTEGTACTLDEHTHSVDCYSDDTADVETSLDWQEMFADYPYTESLRENLAGIAKTQVGYAESTRNFALGSDGIRRGYTRYGAWYGAPYNDWSAMFVSFCLHYAGADPEENPGNTGADSMAELWNNLGKYVPAGEYVPIPGDLIFFTDNTVGIIIEVQNATLYVIRGDVENQVIGELLPMTHENIQGWGLTEAAEEPAAEPEADVSATEEVDLLDISNGPAIYLLIGEKVQRQTQTYTLRNSGTATDLLSYLQTNGGNYFYTLLDMENKEPSKDADGNYIVQPNTGYKLTITFQSPHGFLPGTYQYQVPNGLMVDGGEGKFILNEGMEVGTWTVTDTGLITLVFNEHVNSLTDITISSTLGLHFPEQDEPIDFDGQITVVVEKPPAQQYPTKITKWGMQGGTEGADGDDPSKIYWKLEIIGQADSQIPGNILTDQAYYGEWSKTHKFTESDLAGGLEIGVSENGNWHNWHVAADDPHLVWTETGWSYKMPKTATCQWCGELTLGNDGWIYYISYTSTPDHTGVAGKFGYENTATLDGQNAYAWVDFEHGEATGSIAKNGTFVSDAGGGAFLWEFRATIPGRPEDQKAMYHWYIMDNLKLKNQEGVVVGLVENDAHLATVTTVYNGQTIEIPRIQDATEDDLFAWDNGWSSTENGITYGREFNILSRCRCTPETCHWESGCGEYWYKDENGNDKTNGFCQCWTETQEMTFTFVYKTNDLSMMEAYGGLGYKLWNHVELFHIPEGSTGSASVDDSEDEVLIPGLFKKELTHDFDGYTANYKITVNEAKLVLTDGSPLHIRDEMTDTLAFISGSLVITTEDANGNTAELRQGVDYTVTYDGTGNQKNANGKTVHVLDIVILHPQPVMYTLDYDTILIFPEQVTQGIRYSNSASITLWGDRVADTTVEKVYADINIAAKSYRVDLFKTCADTGQPLSGATFGLYNDSGGLITTGTTNVHGELFFSTNIENGIILREHILYYVQELEAPAGYKLDSTPHWFCFCNETTETCTQCDAVMAGVDAVRIPFERIGKVDVVNEMLSYELPETGGIGIYPFVLGSVILILTPLIYGFIRRRKQERRGVG